MSTFDGKIYEIPYVSVDRFDGENVNSIIYFLSHCHWDHMKGLEDWAFHQSLVQRPDVFLYASPISVQILKGLFPPIQSKLKVLSLYSSTLIKFPYSDNKYLTVTPLPAGHCPGSVMFLFETAEKNILYTGDYRVSASDLKKYRPFYSLGKLKRIDKLYLDTTFFKRTFLRWPLRKESLDNISKIATEWIKQSKQHIVKIALSARYGSEFLFIEIAKALGMPVHVSSETYNVYRHIPEMDEAITIYPGKTQIHAGCGRGLKDICKISDSLVRVIIPSALWWEGQNFADGITSVTEKGEYRVCYSCHASMEEIKDLLLFLKPEQVEPCVVPTNEKEKNQMLAVLEETIQLYKEQPKEEKNVKLFKITATSSAATNSNAIRGHSTPEKLNDDLFKDILNSPPRNFKRRRLWLGETKETTENSS